MIGPARIAVVTIVHGRHDHLRRQVRSLDRGTRAPDLHVVVAMEDPEVRRLARLWSCTSLVSLRADTDLLPLAEARNAGALRALDLGAEVLVFLDVDCLAGPGLVSGYAHAVEVAADTVWSGPVTYLPAGLGEATLARPWLLDDPHPARPAPAPGEHLLGADPHLFWSLSFALGDVAWDRVGGFHEDYVGYGAEDTDFGLHASARGLHHGWVGAARAYHQHHPVEDPPVEHLADILRNGALFHRRWGYWPMEGWLREFEARGLVKHRADGSWTRSPQAAVPRRG